VKILPTTLIFLNAMRNYFKIYLCAINILAQSLIFQLKNIYLEHKIMRLFLHDRRRFIDLCEGKIDKGSITMMKDVSLMQKGATGEHLYNKAQDIAFDDVLSQYILHDRVKKLF